MNTVTTEELAKLKIISHYYCGDFEDRACPDNTACGGVNVWALSKDAPVRETLSNEYPLPWVISRYLAKKEWSCKWAGHMHRAIIKLKAFQKADGPIPDKYDLREAEVAEFIDGTKLTEKPNMKKPQCVYIDPTAVEKLKDPDCLSLKATIFRNGGRVGGEDEMIEAVPFVELTPDLLVWLRNQEFDSRSGMVRWGFTARK